MADDGSGPDCPLAAPGRLWRRQRGVGGVRPTGVRPARRGSGGAGALPAHRRGYLAALLRRRRTASLRRHVDLPHDQQQTPAGREDGALLASCLCHRICQGPACRGDERPDQSVPPRRHEQYARHIARTLHEPGHDLLAGQQREPQRRTQRELWTRTAGTVLDGRGQLLGGGHQELRSRLHRLDLHAAGAHLPPRLLSPPFPLPRRSPR